MTELHSNGQHEAYLAQLLNPQFAGAQMNPGLFNTLGGGAFGGVGGTIPNIANQTQNPWAQNPWAMQNVPQGTAQWPQLFGQQTFGQQAPNPVQSLAAIQLAQQVAARQLAQALQNAQALQALQQQAAQQQVVQQYLQNQGPQQQWGQAGFGQPTPFGYGGNIGQFGGGTGMQNLINQALQQQSQQQALQQFINYLAATQGGQFRYGLAA